MWVNMDHDFGWPYITLTVGVRKLVVDGLRVEACRTPETIAELAKDLQVYVVRHRPNLEGCQVVGISSRFGLKVDITVVHTSLPQVKFGCEAPRECLELCAACGKSMLDSQPVWISQTPYGNTVTVCDERCANKLKEPML